MIDPPRDVSEQMRAEFRELEVHGIVYRKIYPVVPPPVEYH